MTRLTWFARSFRHCWKFHIMVVVLGWGFWRINERKDAALRELYEQVAAMSRAQTAAVIQVEVALKDAIEDLRDRAA